MSVAPEMNGLPVEADDWPWGLRCGECGVELHDGDRYSERFFGVAVDTPVVVIVCLDCALRGDLHVEA